MTTPPFLMQYSASTSSVLLSIIFAYCLHRFFLYPLYLSPLSRIPGPTFAALSRFYLDWYHLHEKGAPHIKELHRKYGPIVRTGPAEVSINDPKHLATIYGIHSTFPKPPTAVMFGNYGVPNTFSSRFRDEHRQRRRMTAKVYTMNAILRHVNLMDFIQDRLNKVVRLIDEQLNQVVDLYPLAFFFAIDNVSFMALGETFDCLGGKNPQARKYINDANVAGFPATRFIYLLTICRVWPLRYLLPRSIMDAFIDLCGGTEAIVKRIFDEVTASGQKRLSEDTAIGYMRAQPEFNKTFADENIMSECCDHINAGGDTTATSIIYLIYTLALPKNRAYQERLRAEVSTLPLPYSYKDVCNLPFLNTCMYELLRLHSPATGTLQYRRTPADAKSTVITVADKTFELPPNTDIGIESYSLHRNEQVFGEHLDEFWPERWEQAEPEQLQRMMNAWTPFGSGARVCLGMNIAIVELKLFTATLLRHFTVEVPAGVDRKDMAPVLGAVVRPKSGQCKLIFKKV